MTFIRSASYYLLYYFSKNHTFMQSEICNIYKKMSKMWKTLNFYNSSSIEIMRIDYGKYY